MRHCYSLHWDTGVSPQQYSQLRILCGILRLKYPDVLSKLEELLSPYSNIDKGYSFVTKLFVDKEKKNFYWEYKGLKLSGVIKKVLGVSKLRKNDVVDCEDSAVDNILMYRKYMAWCHSDTHMLKSVRSILGSAGVTVPNIDSRLSSLLKLHSWEPTSKKQIFENLLNDGCYIVLSRDAKAYGGGILSNNSEMRKKYNLNIKGQGHCRVVSLDNLSLKELRNKAVTLLAFQNHYGYALYRGNFWFSSMREELIYILSYPSYYLLSLLDHHR